MKDRVDLGGWLYTKTVYPSADIHPTKLYVYIKLRQYNENQPAVLI